MFLRLPFKKGVAERKIKNRKKKKRILYKKYLKLDVSCCQIGKKWSPKHCRVILFVALEMFLKMMCVNNNILHSCPLLLQLLLKLIQWNEPKCKKVEQNTFLAVTDYFPSTPFHKMFECLLLLKNLTINKNPANEKINFNQMYIL